MKIISKMYGNTDEGRLKVSLHTNEEKLSVSFGNGEPEDMILCRDLSDAFSIPKMLEAAYNAGKNGEDLEIINIDKD